MPFDDTDHGRGGGGDGHNGPTENDIIACAAVAAMLAQARKLCVSCTMMDVGIYIVARSLANSADVIADHDDMHNGDIDGAIARYVRDVMQEIADKFSAEMQKRAEEKEKKHE